MLMQRYSQREARQLMRILLEDLFGIDIKQELLHPEMRIDERQQVMLKEAVNALLEGAPVQYVTGIARFDDLTFRVNPSVLIPRPETEELVHHVVSSAPNDRRLRIWDVGTGSGCIAIALAKRLASAEVFAFDIDENALETAKQNAMLNQVDVQFVEDDVLNPKSECWERPVDIVVSNPPYVREEERTTMESSVLDHEPEIALFVPDDDPLLFYRQILTLAKPQLNPGGVVWFEINEALGEDMLCLCKEQGFQADLWKDFAGKPRFVCAVRWVE